MAISYRAWVFNTLWSAANLRAAASFRRALDEPGRTQRHRLSKYLAQNADTVIGRMFDYKSIRTYTDYASRVPLMSYEDLAPYIDRIRRGERNVLTSGKVTHLAPTSGTSQACKLIPFGPELQAEFAGAVAVWMSDLFRQYPRIKQGRAYWSVTPPATQGRKGSSFFARDLRRMTRCWS